MPGKQLKQKRDSLARFLAYVLGHRPDEFGLAPDEEGYVSFKELMMALSEEEGWSYIRKSNIEELLREPDGSGLEIKDKMIRTAPDRTNLTLGAFERVLPPKQVFYAAKHKTYPVILERGLQNSALPWVILSDTREMAMRRGKRRDPHPILITIQAEKAHERGVMFFRPQEHLFLVESLAPEFLIGPPVPKEKEAPGKKKKETQPPAPPTPGSFFLDILADQESERRGEKRTKKKKGDGPEWKRAARKERRRRIPESE